MNALAQTPPLMLPEAAAETLGISVETLADWRCRHPDKLPYVKVGRCVRYARKSVEEFIAANTVGATTPSN